MSPPATTRRHFGSRAPWLALVFLLLTMVLPRFAVASPAQEVPVIVPGREAEILALFEPYALGDALSPGWTLRSFAVDVGTIDVWLEGPEQAHAHLSLDHPDHGPAGAQSTTGFALYLVDQPPGSEPGLAALVKAIEANDDGSFWGREVVYAEESRKYRVSLGEGLGQLPGIRAWLYDGVLQFLALAGLLLGLSLHKLRGAAASIKWSLAGIVLGAALLRVLLSPAVALAAWPYTRILLSAERVFSGPLLALAHPEPVWLSELILDSTMAYAMLAPLAVYVHARYLLEDQRGALLAALLVAILPLHLRFSHSDVAFIPSITVSSTCFALIHAVTRERSKLLGWGALVLLGPLVAMMYSVRPLNLMYYPLLLATVFVNQGAYADKPELAKYRTLIVVLLITGVTFGLGLPALLEDFGSQVQEGLSVETLLAAAGVVFSPRFNVLLNPSFTPPGLTLFALYGGYDLWRRGRRRLCVFLLAWLLGFLVAHAYVVPISVYMQARYYLHLIVPYMLLATCGIEASVRWLARDSSERPGWTRGREKLVQALGLGYLLSSPLVHLHAIRHVEFNDAQEWLFVHRVRDAIPPGCTIIEYTGNETDMRFRRVGTAVSAGVVENSWTIHEITMPAEGEPELPDSVRAVLEAPPECLYWYEGLPCYGNKTLEQDKAPVCHAIEGWVELEEVASMRIESEPYDGNLAFGLGDIESFELRLFRATPKHGDEDSGPQH